VREAEGDAIGPAHAVAAMTDDNFDRGFLTAGRMMNDRRVRTIATVIAVVRLGAGVVLGGSPAAFLRWEPDISRGSSMMLRLRTVGIRDLALGVGTVSALRSGSSDELQRWVRAGMLSDVLDVGAGLSSTHTTGVRGLVSALVASPLVILDTWALMILRETLAMTAAHQLAPGTHQ
jgi:hypothetical protein